MARKYVFLIWITFCLCVFAFSGQATEHFLILRRHSPAAAMTGGSTALSKEALGPEGKLSGNMPRAGCGFSGGQSSPGPLSTS